MKGNRPDGRPRLEAIPGRTGPDMTGDLPVPHPYFDYDPSEDIEIPYAELKTDGPECPFCGEPTMLVDGDFVCIDCNGGWYGPEIG
jgi:hypothetical protein